MTVLHTKMHQKLKRTLCIGFSIFDLFENELKIRNEFFEKLYFKKKSTTFKRMSWLRQKMLSLSLTITHTETETET